MKTQNEILSDIYARISSYLGEFSGKVYKYTRPLDSTKEDVVISLLGNVTSKFQNINTLYIQCFCEDILVENTYYPDFLKLDAFERLLYKVSTELSFSNTYQVDLRTRTFDIEQVRTEGRHTHKKTLTIQIINL